MTARWVVDAVVPERELAITWQPISLLKKNDPDPDGAYYEAAAWSHGLLRVMESVRASDGDDAVLPVYWEYGRRIHHDKDRAFAPQEALSAVGLDERHASAATDESWDAEIDKRMSVGLDLAGTDIGTPLIALDDEDGARVALFGPVITRVPERDQSLRLWDAFVTMARVPGFWEVKRTRTERPEFGDRP